MYISLKYVFLYVLAGGATALIFQMDRRAGAVGVIVSVILGSRFGGAYAILSAIEFMAGFGLVVWLSKKSELRK